MDFSRFKNIVKRLFDRLAVRKVSRRLRLPHIHILWLPSQAFLTIAILAATLILLGGGLYVIVQGSLPMVPWGQSWLFYWPGSIRDQTLLEFIYTTTMLSSSLLGLLIIYETSRRVYEPKYATMLFIVGMLILILSFAFIEWIFLKKVGLIP